MIIYKDIISKDEMFSDTYPMKDDGVVYEVEGKFITEKAGIDNSLLGANPSQGGGEGGEDDAGDDVGGQVDDATISGCNIVLANRLVKTSFTKKSFQVYVKDYMKSLKDQLTARKQSDQQIKDFQTAAQAFVKRVLAEFDNFDFYTGESSNPEGMVALLNFREDGVTPFMLFFKHGLDAEKV
uniref:Translationally-controlled tumor protein homolog n=1 Tax=Fredericella sultana TaxID=349672 RepID=I4E9A0_9BILA|nr:translationally controlled tumour protein [Fredericella sultana]